MRRKKRTVPGLDPVRTFPYFKIQYRNDQLGVWTDVQKKFPTLESLTEFARQNLEMSLRTRIMKVEDYGSRRVLDNPDAFGN